MKAFVKLYKENHMKFVSVVLLILAVISGCTKGSNESAIKDVFFHALQSEPSDLHPIRMAEIVSRQIVIQSDYYGSNIVETLLATDHETYENEANLAERWTVSPDGKTFTFFLRKDVVFHDGSKMTSADVKFSFDALFDDLFESYPLRSYYEKFNKEANVIDEHTISFTAKDTYYLNLQVIGGLRVFPKATYSKQTKENRLAKTVVGSGAYKFEKWNKGKSLTITQNPDWWGLKDPLAGRRYKFKKIVFKFVKEATLRRAMLERGKLDFDNDVREEDFAKKMNEKPWGETVLAVKAVNQVPKNLSFIGLNNKNKILKDKKVRQALAHLVNRDFLNEKFYYNLRNKATGPFRVQGQYANPNVKPRDYNPEKAKKLLTDAGWADTDKDGLLDKVIEGERISFQFDLMNPNKDSEKILTVVKEDMKKAGVQMNINVVDWNAFTKALDERKFDAVIMSWGGGGVHPDPTQIWHSKSAAGTGSNFVSYSNPEADRLIEKSIYITDKKERTKVFHKLHEIIAEDAPYIFYFEPKYELYAVGSRVKRPGDTKPYSIGVQYWVLPE